MSFPTFTRPSVDALDDVYELLLIVHCPIYFVIVPCAQINHHVFVPARKTDSTLIYSLALSATRHFGAYCLPETEVQYKMLESASQARDSIKTHR